MRRTLLLAVVTVLTIVAGAAAVAQPAFFPLAPGNRWVLSDAGSRSVTAVVVRRQAPGLALHGFPGLRDSRARALGGSVQVWDAGDARWESLLRLVAPAGTKYTVRLSRNPLWQSVVVSVESRNAALADPSGRLRRGCVTLAFRSRGKAVDVGLEEMTFAPGVGPVRLVEQTIAGPRTKLLAGWQELQTS
jgi:hypothetical protein